MPRTPGVPSIVHAPHAKMYQPRVQLQQKLPSLVHVEHVADVLGDGSGGHQLLGGRVGDFEHELILHGHDDFHMVQAVQTQVLHEVGVQVELFWIYFIIKIKYEYSSLLNRVNAHRR